MGRKYFKAIITLVCILIFAACKKDGPANPVSPPTTTGEHVYIVCEGSLGNGNAALSLFLPDKDSAYDDIYKAVNNQSLGDIFQSMNVIGDSLFLIINNSDKIIVINRNTWKYAGVINIPKPRYMLVLNATKAYVSTLFSNKVYIIDPQTLQVTGSINMPYQNPEGMLLYNNTAFINTWDTSTNQLSSLNTTTDQFNTSITVAGRAPSEAVLDKNGKMWVLSGNQYDGKTAAITCIDPSNGQTIRSCTFPATAAPMNITFNNSKDTLYYIEVNYNGGTTDNGIYRMSITDASLPATAFVPAKSLQYFWALGIDPKTGLIYIGDPMGFTQRGNVYIYQANGSLVNQFKTSVGPGHFLFD